MGSLYSKKSRLIKCRLLFYQLRLPLRWKLAVEKGRGQFPFSFFELLSPLYQQIWGSTWGWVMEGPSWLFSLSTPEGSPEAPHETPHCPEMGNAFPNWTVITIPTLSTRLGELPLLWYGQDYLTGLLSYVGLLPDGFSYNPHCLLGPQIIPEYTPPLPTTVFFPFPLFTCVFSLAFKLCFLMYDPNMFPNTKKHSLSFPDVSLKPFSLGLSKDEAALSFLYVWLRGRKRGSVWQHFFQRNCLFNLNLLHPMVDVKMGGSQKQILITFFASPTQEVQQLT